jgi:hypothetical protein
MLRDIVDELVSGTDDVDIAGEVLGGGAAAALRETRANFVISGRDDERLVTELLAERPDVEVLVVTHGGRTGTVHRLIRQQTQLHELSSDRLLEIVRAAMPTTEP